MPTRWEHKCGSFAYIITDKTKQGLTSYTYVAVTFSFKKCQIQALLAGDIHFVMLTFLDRKTLRGRCLVVEGARLAANYVRGKPTFQPNGNMTIIATQLVDTPDWAGHAWDLP